MSKEDFASLRRKSAQYYVQGGKLMRRHSPMAQLVVSSESFQEKLMRMVHEDLGHRGVEETYSRLVQRFCQDSLYCG